MDNTQRTPQVKWTRALMDALTGPEFLILLVAIGSIGLLYARALLSIYSGALMTIALLQFFIDRSDFSEIRSYKSVFALTGVLLVYLISGINSDDLAKWSQYVWENITYLTIPIGFYVFRRHSPMTWRTLLVLFVLVMTLSALSVSIDYLLHFEEYNALYRVGKTIPTPVIHVRYSFFMALAACLAIGLVLDSRPASVKSMGTLDRLLLVAALFLALFVHILAVRTGILSMYGGILVMLVLLMIKEGRWRLGLTSAAIVVVLIFIAFNAFPSLSNKIGYVMYDLDMMRKHGALANYSDNIRITSLQHGLELFSQQPITGVGIGDLESEVSKQYQKHTPDFPLEHHYPPINQYLFVLTAFGLAGASVYFFSLLYPLFTTRFNYVLVAIYAATLFSLFGETTIQLQLGRTTFLTLVCIAILLAKSKETKI